MMKKRWIWAVLLSLILFGLIFSVIPFYGINIFPNFANGFSETGGNYGHFDSSLPVTCGYSGG